MTTTVNEISRRGFLRTLGGAALGVVTAGTQLVLGAGPAAAAGCCSLAYSSWRWCQYKCSEWGFNYYCWSCGPCYCCECTTGSSCHQRYYKCSYTHGYCG